MDVSTEIQQKTSDFLLHLYHLYQPPHQSDDWIFLIADQCYRPLSRWLAQNNFPVAINISYSLIKHLRRLRLEDIIENLGEAAEKGTIEFTGSAAYHPILPLLLSHKGGESEVKRQIELNDRLNREVFGNVWKPALPQNCHLPQKS